MALRFISWIAVSSAQQLEKESPESQRRDNKAIVDKYNGQLRAELEVPGMSRSFLSFDEACRQVPAYEQLRQLIDHKGADVLVCREHARLGRTSSLILEVIQRCHRAGIALYFRNSPPSTLDAAEQARDHSFLLTAALLGQMAQNEIMTFRQRYQDGMRGRVESGRHFNRIPYGWQRAYDTNGQAIACLNPEAAKVIRYAFLELLVNRGLTLADAARELNARAYRPPKGDQWTASVLSSLLRRLDQFSGWTEGNLKSGKVRARASFEPILSEDEAAHIHQLIQARRGGRSGWRKYWFSLAIICGKCGRHMGGSTPSPKRWPHLRYYRCNFCREEIPEWKAVEQLRNVVAFLQEPENRAAVVAQQPDPTLRIQQEIGEIAKQVEMAKKTRLNLARQNAAGYTSDEEFRQLVEEQATLIAGLDLRKAALEQELVDAQDVSRRLERVDQFAGIGPELIAKILGDAVPDQAKVRQVNAHIQSVLRFCVQGNEIVRIEYL